MEEEHAFAVRGLVLMGEYSPKILGEHQDSSIPDPPCNIPEFHLSSRGPVLGSQTLREEKTGSLESVCYR